MNENCIGCGKPIPDHLDSCPYCTAPAKKIVTILPPREVEDKDFERQIWDGSPVWKAYTGWFILAFITIFTVIIPIVVIIYVLLEKYSCQYKVTSKRILCKYGILSKRTCEIDIRDIRSTNVSQSFIQRIFGVGNLEFATASGPLKEAVIIKIDDPECLKERIRALK